MFSRLGSRRSGRRGATAAASAAVAALACAALAPAAGPVASQLQVLEAGVNDGSYLSIGTVTAAKKICVGDRKVKFIVKRPSGNEVLDVARTSDHGGWTSIVPEPEYSDGGVNGTAYKLASRKVRKGDTKIRCGGDKVTPS